jgi:hypothetical protein
LGASDRGHGPPPGEERRESTSFGAPASVSFDELIHPMNHPGESQGGVTISEMLAENRNTDAVVQAN